MNQVNGVWNGGLQSAVKSGKTNPLTAAAAGGVGGLALGAMAGAAMGHRMRPHKIKFDLDDSDEILDNGLGLYGNPNYQRPYYYPYSRWPPGPNELDETPLTTTTTTTSTPAPAENEEAAVDSIKAGINQRSTHFNLNKETVDIPSVAKHNFLRHNAETYNAQAPLNAAYNSEQGQSAFGEVWFVGELIKPLIKLLRGNSITFNYVTACVGLRARSYENSGAFAYLSNCEFSQFTVKSVLSWCSFCSFAIERTA